MNTENRPKRLYLLWFVAAALALAAAVIEFVRLQVFNWTGTIMGGICLLMGLVSMKRSARGDTTVDTGDADAKK